jgi:glycosyltransferase involved in cell wall biosynthesis
MTSSWEGFPLSLCEALACGVPAIAADCFTGPREVIARGIAEEQPIKKPAFSSNGVLMPLADTLQATREWSDTIVSVLKNDLLRNQLSRSGPERVKHFDIGKIQNEWLKIVNE